MKLKISMVTKNGGMCFSSSLEIEKYFYISKVDKYKICNEYNTCTLSKMILLCIIK